MNRCHGLYSNGLVSKYEKNIAVLLFALRVGLLDVLGDF